jgi:antitoxin VapB
LTLTVRRYKFTSFEAAMARTRVFKSGNSQAIRIPAEIAYEDGCAELEITRSGDVITIYPARSGIKHAVEMLRQMPQLKHISAPRTLSRKTRWD